MEREVFAARLTTAARRAWAAARPYVLEDLPSELVFRVRLNQSNDHAPMGPGERRFPEDASLRRVAVLHRCAADTVVRQLWRDVRPHSRRG